jgi:hypothetical protein
MSLPAYIARQGQHRALQPKSAGFAEDTAIYIRVGDVEEGRTHDARAHARMDAMRTGNAITWPVRKLQHPLRL